MLKYRLIFGPIMILALLAILLADGYLDQVDLTGTHFARILGRTYLPSGLLLFALIVVLMGFAAREMCHMFRAKAVPVHTTMIAVAGVVGCTLIYLVPYDTDSQTTMAVVATLFVGTVLVTLVQYSWLEQRVQGAIIVGAATALALIYMGMLPGFYLAIRRWHSAWVIVAIILVTKSCDIGAYFTGRAIGRHKLIPWLSPKKTWEGLIGGVLFASLVCVGLAALFNYLQAAFPDEVRLAGYFEPSRVFKPTPYPLAGAAVAGAVFGLVGQFGDLTASLFKRDAGIKDSGRSIPGFGGIIDVVDSPILVAPVAYWTLMLARGG